MLHVELTNEDIRNSAAYKEYYAIASGATPPKTKASVRKTHSSFDTTMRATPPKTKASVRKMHSSFDTTMSPPTASGTRLSTSAKGKQPAKSSKAKDLSSSDEDDDDDDDVDDQSDAADEDDDDKKDDDEQDDDDQDDNDDDQDSNNDGDDFVHPKLTTHDEEAKDEEIFDPIVQNNPATTNFGAPIRSK
nr:hypothetical protein [Tanacetum cinerariifolium]